MRPGPLAFRLFRNEGTLIDVSRTGAKARLPKPEPLGTPFTSALDCNGEAVLLRGRVVRCIPHRIQLPTAVLARTEYHVAFEFADLPDRSNETLARLLASTPV